MKGNTSKRIKALSVVAGILFSAAVSCDSGSGDGSVLDKAYNAARDAGNNQPSLTLPDPNSCRAGIFTYNCQ